VVFCGVRLSEVGVAEIRKPQVPGWIPVADSIAFRKLIVTVAVWQAEFRIVCSTMRF